MQEEILAIIGGRDFKNKNRVFFEIDEYRKTHNVIAIVSGVSIDDKSFRGADTLGRDYAKEKGLKYIGFTADWDDMSEPCVKKINLNGKEYNALAGFKRNTFIVEKATKTIMAFWDGKSHGTDDSIKKAKSLNKEVLIKKY